MLFLGTSDSEFSRYYIVLSHGYIAKLITLASSYSNRGLTSFLGFYSYLPLVRLTQPG